MSPKDSRSRGRPRSFDRDKALEAAMVLFWRHGYEGASIAQLSEAMGVAPPSLYSAFGSKEGLYREALEFYLAGPGDIGAERLAEAEDLRAAASAVLAAAATAYTRPEYPPGCMVGSGGLHCGEDNQIAVEVTAEKRAATRRFVLTRLEQACAAGELPADTNVEALTDFFGAVVEGMSIQARDGASRERLLRLAEQAMRAWPEREN